MIDLIGWIGNFCLGICALPQAIESYKTKSSHGISINFLLLWLFGELLTIYYVFLERFSFQLLSNYTFNLIILLVILRYHPFWSEIYEKFITKKEN